MVELVVAEAELETVVDAALDEAWLVVVWLATVVGWLAAELELVEFELPHAASAVAAAITTAAVLIILMCI